ncbi:MAG: protein BatD, partial [Candidatus Aminicenantes bacterium]|nr:protein BatD [Candidatus Aminicenantes bacterium]
ELPDLLGFWIEDYELPPRPVTREEVVGGKRYLVAEIKKSALFPTAAGERTIDPLEIECEVRVRDRSTRDIFDRFFDDDFFSSPFGRTVQAKIASEPVKINVSPLPNEGRPPDFSGAVGRFKLESSLDKEQVTANEALSIKIKISGTGNIKMLPEPEIAFPREFETYDPKVELRVNRKGNAISGSKEYEYVLIPRRGGEFRIPSFSFSYFDPDAGIYKTLETPEYTLTVAAGDGSAAQVPAGLSRRNIEYIGKDIRFIKPASPDFHRIGSYFYRSFWFIFLIALGILALAGAGIYRQRINRMAENIAYARSLKAQKAAKQRLSRARKLMTEKKQTEFYAELSQALLGFVADKLNLPTAGLMTDEIREKLAEWGVETSIISELLDCLGACDFYRFAPAENIQTEMETHYQKAKEAIIKLDKAKLS